MVLLRRLERRRARRPDDADAARGVLERRVVREVGERRLPEDVRQRRGGGGVAWRLRNELAIDKMDGGEVLRERDDKRRIK